MQGTFLDHPGEMAERIRRFDWSRTPLGAPADWPMALKLSLNICLGSSFPTAIYWGPELRLLYNDAWAVVPAERHPDCLGQAAEQVWPDIWNVVGPQFDQVLATGEGFATYDQMLPMVRGGKPRETWWNYSFTAIRDEDGRVVGVFNQGNETTANVLAERNRRAEVERLHDLVQQAPGAMAVLHGPDFRFAMTNSAYLELIGRDDVLGKTVAEALPEVVGQGFIALLNRVWSSGEAFRADKQPIRLRRNAQGEEETRILNFVYQPIRDATGAVASIFVDAYDVTEQAIAERALRRSEQRLQLALNASDGIATWEWDVEARRIDGDARYAALLGVPGDSDGSLCLTQDRLLSLVHEDDRAALVEAARRAVAEDEHYRIEHRIIGADGVQRWITSQGRAIAAEGGSRRLAGVSLDVTERRSSEEAARATAEELRAANETQTFLYSLAERQRTFDNPDSILRFTAAALMHRLAADRVGFYRVRDDRLEFGPCATSEKLPSLTGTAPCKVLGAHPLDAYRSGRTVVLHDSMRAAEGDLPAVAGAGVGVPLVRGGVWMASMYVNQATPRRWSSEEIAFIEAIAEISWDAVERVAAIAALRESESKFRGITNSIDQMVWSATPDGAHDYFNDRWYAYTGAERGSTDRGGWIVMFHPDDRARADRRWRQSLESGEPYHIEYRLRHHTGIYRWVLGRAQPVRDDAGRITRWFGTCTDIQEIVDAREVLARSRAELEQEIEQRTRQLMRAEEQLRQSQKMEAIGKLTGGIAHDFNNMLAVVIGALDLLERRIRRGETDVGRYVAAAQDGAARAAALTQRLLAFARQQPLAAISVDVNAMIGNMIELLIHTLGENVTIETALSGDVESVLVDPGQLENVLVNLSVNARDAMPEGGLLTIETTRVALVGESALSRHLPPGEYVRIDVRDTGHGMPPEIAERAFDPFFTTKDVGKGTGLGLSQAFGFLRQSGGHVELATTSGEGTTVSLHLPVGNLRADAERSAHKIGAEGGEVPRGREDEVVLVVEDEEQVRAYSVEVLRELGYAVRQARDGQEALSIIERGQDVALLFTDMVMPMMDGRELARHARQRIPGLKVLYTSGYTRRTPEEEEALEADGGILPKPFDIAQLACRVREVLDRR